jgi:cyclase
MESDFSLQEVVPGIFYVTGGICNRGLIVGDGHVLVIDSGISRHEAVPLHRAAHQRRDQGALQLFNTHPHLDHTFGNQMFADSAIIAHKGVRDTLINTGEQMLANIQKNPQMAELIGEVTITPPTVIFTDQLSIFVGEIEVQLLYFGVAHSPSDSVAWLPQTKTLFTGDLLFNQILPATPPGSNIATWIGALEQLELLGAEHVIPGHGPVQSPEALGALRTWFEALRGQVREAIAQGWSLETAIERIPAQMQALAPRNREERFPAVIRQMFEEITHE